jgi:hypothetical protein
MNAGVLLLAFLPLSGFPPHLAFLGIAILITVYSLVIRRPWANWLAEIKVILNSVFGLYTAAAVGLSNIRVFSAALTYAVATWAVPIMMLLKIKD